MARETRQRERVRDRFLGNEDRPVHAERDDPYAGDLAEDEIEVRDRTGNRWALRPARPGRYDYMGFGAFWWLLFWLVIAALVIWWAWT